MSDLMQVVYNYNSVNRSPLSPEDIFLKFNFSAVWICHRLVNQKMHLGDVFLYEDTRHIILLTIPWGFSVAIKINKISHLQTRNVCYNILFAIFFLIHPSVALLHHSSCEKSQAS